MTELLKRQAKFVYEAARIAAIAARRRRHPMNRGRFVALLYLVYLLAIAGLPSALAADNCIVAPNPTGADDTAALNTWIAAIPSGGCGRVVAGPKGAERIYKVEGSVVVDGQANITLHLAAATFRASSVVGDIDPGPKTDWRQHFKIMRAAGITINGLRIENIWDCTFNTLYEGEAAFLVNESSGVLLSGVSVSGVAGDGVLVAGGSGITVSGATFDCTGRMGVTVDRTSSNILVTGSILANIARSAFDIELTADTYTATDIRFEFNTIGTHGIMVLAAGGLGSKSGVVFKGNVITTKPIRIKYVGSDLSVIGNQGTGQAQTAFLQASHGTGLVVANNVQHFWPGAPKNPPAYAIVLNDWCEASATGNDFTGSAGLYQGTPNPGCVWVGTPSSMFAPGATG